MASSNTLTWDQNPPRRPSLSDLGGGAKENSVVHPPDPVTMLTAEDVNQEEKQLEGLGRVTYLARVLVTFSGGAPSIANVQAPGSAVTTGSFMLVDEGAGVTLVKWTTGSGGALPTAVGVIAHQIDDVEIDRGPRAILTSDGGQPAARVKTKLGATGTDANFCLEIF